MSTSQVSKIALLKLDIFGPEYSLEIERDVRQSLGNEGFPVVVTGEHAPAAGPALDYQLACFVRDSIASALIYDLFKFAVGKVAEAFQNAGKSNVLGTRIKVIASDCELVLSANASVGVDAAKVPYEDLITKMSEFVSAEADKGFPVKCVEAPCELFVEGDRVGVRCQGVGDFYLWRVSYKDGEKWPAAILDAANGRFVDLTPGAVTSYLRENDERACLSGKWK